MSASTSRAALCSFRALVDGTTSQRTACRHAARFASTRQELRTALRHQHFSTYWSIQGAAITGARFASTATAPAAAKPAASSPPAASSSSSTTTSRPTSSTAKPSNPTISDLKNGLKDSSPTPLPDAPPSGGEDWTRSFHGLSSVPFSAEAATILLEPIPAADIEIKPDGIVYLPEIKYRRILNRAFGPGAWGLAPRGETLITGRSVTREYGLVVQGRLVSIARGEQQYFDPEGIPTATEGCKSNALMRCCKDLGIASELWDPVFIRGFMAKHAREVWVEHVTTKKKRKITVKKGVDGGGVFYPYKETKA